MKVALIIFHKNISRYPKLWIDEFVRSIKNQTYKDFDVFEVNYGGESNQIYEGSIFESLRMPTHADAHNYLLDKVFALGYDYAFNTNVDDYYDTSRIERQLKYIVGRFDMVSSNFYCINSKGKKLDAKKFNSMHIGNQLSKGHNIIAHPACCYSKKFWLNCDKLNPNQIPEDDFQLWKRELAKGAKFFIVPEMLLYYRIHENNTGNIQKNNIPNIEEKYHDDFFQLQEKVNILEKEFYEYKRHSADHTEL